MKKFKDYVQKACEDYLKNLPEQPTLDTVAQMCKTDISSIVWKAVSLYLDRVKDNKSYLTKRLQETKINGISESAIKNYLWKSASSLVGKTVGNVVNALNNLFKTADKYGFSFAYGTVKGYHKKLEHTPEDHDLVLAISLIKK